jgi:hypothetical protein
LQALNAAVQSALDGADIAERPKVEVELPAPSENMTQTTELPSQVMPGTTDPTTKYIFATPNIEIGDKELHLIPTIQLEAWLAQVAEIEGPVHWLEATRRIASAAGVHRVGTRIQDAFRRACISGSRRKLFIQKDDFLHKVGCTETPVRDRSDFQPQLKKLEYVAPEEIHAAIELSVNESFGLDEGEVANAVCHLLGFSRVTLEMRATVEDERDHLISSRRLTLRGDVLVCNGGSKQDTRTSAVQ